MINSTSNFTSHGVLKHTSSSHVVQVYSPGKPKPQWYAITCIKEGHLYPNFEPKGLLSLCDFRAQKEARYLESPYCTPFLFEAGHSSSNRVWKWFYLWWRQQAITNRTWNLATVGGRGLVASSVLILDSYGRLYTCVYIISTVSNYYILLEIKLSRHVSVCHNWLCPESVATVWNCGTQPVKTEIKIYAVKCWMSQNQLKH